MSTIRLGFIIPSVNTVLEDELRMLLPPDVSFHCCRIPLTGGPEAERQLLELKNLVPIEAEKLADAKVDAVVLACTAASVVIGEDYDRTLSQSIAERANRPAITAAAATLQALSHVRATNVNLLTPYAEWLHTLEAAYLSSRGLTVHSQRITLAPPELLGDVPADELCDEMVAINQTLPGNADAVLVSCANARVWDRVESLESRMGTPVVTSNQAAVWAALTLVGYDTTSLNWGALTDAVSHRVSSAHRPPRH